MHLRQRKWLGKVQDGQLQGTVMKSREAAAEGGRGRWTFLSRCDGLITYIEGNCSYFHVELQAGDFQKPNSSKQMWSCLQLKNYLSHIQWFITMKNKKVINYKNVIIFNFPGMDLLKNSKKVFNSFICYFVTSLFCNCILLGVKDALSLGTLRLQALTWGQEEE